MALPAADDMAGGAGALSGTWTQQVATSSVNRDGSGFAVSSGAVEDSFVFHNADVFDDDQYSEITFAGTFTAGTTFAGATVRAAGTTGATFDHYSTLTDGSSGASHTYIYEVLNGSFSTLASLAETFAAGDRLTTGIAGDVITSFKNDVSFGSTTDATLTSGSAGFSTNAASGLLIDSWAGGNEAPPIENPPTRSRKLATQQRMVA